MNRLAGIIIEAAWNALAPGAEAGCVGCPWRSESRESYDIGEQREWQTWIECEAPVPERCPIVHAALLDAIALTETPPQRRMT